MIKLTMANNGKPIYVMPSAIDAIIEVHGGGCMVVINRLSYEVKQHPSQVMELMGVKGR